MGSSWDRPHPMPSACLLFVHAVLTQSCPTVCDPWTVAHQTPLSMGLSRQEYWSGLPFPSPGALPDPGIEPESPALKADSFPSEALVVVCP